MTLYYVYYHSYDYVPIHASDVIDELVRAGVRVHVFTSVNPALLRDCDWSALIPVTNIPVVRRRLWERLTYAAQLALHLPFWCFVRRPDLIYERLSMMTVLTACIASVLRIPLVVEINGITLEELRLGGGPKLRMAFTRWYERFCLRRSRLAIAVNDNIRDWFMKTYRLDPGTIRPVYNATNTRRYVPMDASEARRQWGLDAGNRFYVGYCGTLTPWCGIELCIEAAREIRQARPGVEFVIGGGEEPYFTRFRENAAACGCADMFHFFGQIAWSESARFIATFDIALLSLAPPPISGSPQKLYAYLSCGKPVLGSAVGEVAQMLERHGVGIPFTPGDAGSLGRAIIDAASGKYPLDRMGAQARGVIVERHSWEIRVRELLGYINTLVLDRKE
jgi:glycosyltransferase involved in cell wall biosynthesis